MGSLAVDHRRALLAKVHIAVKDLGLDDAVYRTMLERVTGHRSAGDCTDVQLDAVLTEFKRGGWEPRPRKAKAKPAAAKGASSLYLPKLRALWLSGAALGVVRNVADEAMVAFIKRQTGLASERFLVKASDAAKAIEALKAWLTREAGVAWSAHPDNPRRAVAEAIWRKLIEIGDVKPFGDGTSYFDLWEYGRKVTGLGGPQFYSADDWDRVIRALGRKLVEARAES